MNNNISQESFRSLVKKQIQKHVETGKKNDRDKLVVIFVCIAILPIIWFLKDFLFDILVAVLIVACCFCLLIMGLYYLAHIGSFDNIHKFLQDENVILNYEIDEKYDSDENLESEKEYLFIDCRVILVCKYDDFLDLDDGDRYKLDQLLDEICKGIFFTPKYEKYSDVKWRFDKEYEPVVKLKYQNKEISEELEEIFEHNFYVTTANLPTELLKKGKQMVEAYFWIYTLENSIRNFILEQASKKTNDVSNDLKLPRQVLKNIEKKESSREINKWLGVPVQSENILYNVDFKDLAAIIVDNNWEWYKDFFPSQSFIKNRIEELYQIRNFIAHNNPEFTEEHLNQVRIYYNQIMKHIKQ